MESNSSITITPITLANEIRYNNTPILTYQITYPHFSSENNSLGLWRINSFYATRAHGYQDYIQTALKKNAIEDYILRGSIPETAPVYQVISNFFIPYLDDQTASIYTDQYHYLGGAHGSTTRISKNWDLKTGEGIPLTKFFPDLEEVKTNIIQQIEQQIQSGNNIYFKNYKELVEQTFRPEQFYLIPGYIVIFFQQYDIGPYVSGIIEFKIAYP